MNDEEKKKLAELRDKLMDITTSPDALEGLAPDERASMLMFQLKSNENPSLANYEKVYETINEIEDPQVRVDVALDLMGEIDVRTGLLSPDETTEGDEPEEAAPEEQQDENQDVMHEGQEPSEEHHEEHHQG